MTAGSTVLCLHGSFSGLGKTKLQNTSDVIASANCRRKFLVRALHWNIQHTILRPCLFPFCCFEQCQADLDCAGLALRNQARANTRFAQVSSRESFRQRSIWRLIGLHLRGDAFLGQAVPWWPVPSEPQQSAILGSDFLSNSMLFISLIVSCECRAPSSIVSRI